MTAREALEKLRARSVAACARVLAHFLFRRIELEGRERIPTQGSVLVIANHENNLVDPMLMLAFGAHPVRFLAKHTLFGHILVRPLARLVRAVAIYRTEDGGDGRRNETVLARCAARLAGGEVIGVFPEGGCHNESERRPLKAGPARIALEAARLAGARPVWVLPVGLLYVNKSRFRSDVALRAGEPLRVDPQETSRALTARMSEALRAVTLNAPTWSDADAALRDAEQQAGSRPTAPGPLEHFRRWTASLQGERLTLQGPSSLPRWADLPVAVPGLARVFLATFGGLIGSPLAFLPLVLVLLPAHAGRRTPDEPATRRLMAAMVFFAPAVLVNGLVVGDSFGALAGVLASVLTPLSVVLVLKARDVWADHLKTVRLSRG